MRFHQVRELVRWAADFHGRLDAAYTELAAGSGDERVRMALDYLAEHERQMQADLEGYLEERGQHRAVLDTWFDDPEDFPHAPVLDRLTLAAGSVQEVLATALTQHRTLQDLYAHRVERAVAEQEREFFAALVAGHEGEVRRLVRDIQRLEEY